MGIMYTKEEYRRKGYAIDVTIDLAKQIIDAGKIPFIQIVQGNGMSPGLAKKCGFVESGKADWFGIIAGNPKELVESNNNSRLQFLGIISPELHPVIFKDKVKYAALYNFLHNFKFQAAAIEGLNLVKVETDHQMKAWCELESVRYGIKIEKFAVEDSNFNLFLLQRDNQVIAACATHRHEEEDRGLYFMSVLPEENNPSLLKILAMETIKYEKNHGCEYMVTQAEENQIEMFEELGFRKSHSI
jgi:hypothetical protein